jgi:transposase
MENQQTTNGRKRQKGSKPRYNITFKRHVANRYLHGNLSLRQVSEIFNLPYQSICRWAQQFSCELADKIEVIISPMTEQEQQQFDAVKKQNELLQKVLEQEQLKNFALETMIDLAQSELGIDLRKNSGAKQPKE